MTYTFHKLTQKQAETIAYEWHYDGEYSFYNLEEDKEDLEEFLDPAVRGETTFAALKDNSLVAFLTVSKKKERTYEIGLGMRPDLIGQGHGADYLQACVTYIGSTWDPVTITLSVATFNQRAINLYRKIGFEEGETFIQQTNGDMYEFLNMSYKCE